MTWRKHVLAIGVWALATGYVWAGEKELSVQADSLQVQGTVKRSDATVAVMAPAPGVKQVDLPAKLHLVKLSADYLYRIHMFARNENQLDPFLVVQDQKGKQLAFDDDGNGQLNARVLFVPPSDGIYKVFAAALRGEGPYILKIDGDQLHTIPQDGLQITGTVQASDRKVNIPSPGGKGIAGALPAKIFVAKLAGERVYRIDMIAEHQPRLDALLMVLDDQGHLLTLDNDSGGGLNARLLFRAPKDGAFHLCAAAYRGEGNFTLRIRPAKPGEAEIHRADLLRSKSKLHSYAGEFTEAARVAREALALREQWQGKNHGQVIDTRQLMERWLRLADLPVEKQKALAPALHSERTGHGYSSQQKYADAEQAYRRSLEVCSKILGEKHPETARQCIWVAMELNKQHKIAQAQPLYQKALDICLEVLGEKHSDTAYSFNALAENVDAQGKYTQAQPLYEKALAIRQEVLGEKHPDTASSYSNVALNLNTQGKYAQAQPLFQKALEIYVEEADERHPNTATIFNNMAVNLHSQGKYAQAQLFLQKALAIRLEVLGEKHPDTAQSYNNLAMNLGEQGKYTQAQVFLQKALDIFLAIHGEKHPNTARAYHDVAYNLHAQGKYAQAQLLHQKALDIRLEVLGEKHPDTAQSYNNLAENHKRQGQYAQAQPLSQKALNIFREVHGQNHRDTATSYHNLGYNLYAQHKFAEAEKTLRAGLVALDIARIDRAASGFERAVGTRISPRSLLAVLLAHRGALEEAWDQAEANLARGLLDDLNASTKQSDQEAKSRLTFLSKLDERLVPLLSAGKLGPGQKEVRDDLLRQRTEVLDELSERAAKQAAARVLPFKHVQQQLAGDVALLFWVDTGHEVWACVVVREGMPRWHKLPGSARDGGSTTQDQELHRKLYDQLAEAKPDSEAERTRLSHAFLTRYFEPLRPHLKGVHRLLVVPTGALAWVPLEALVSDYTISYVPSGSVYARLAQQHRPLQGLSLFALGDPIFSVDSGKSATPPDHGLFVQLVAPGGNAHNSGVQAGDVLLRYGDTPLKQLSDLKLAQGKFQVNALLWRDGTEVKIRFEPGNLGVSFDKRSVPEAATAWREHKSLLASLHRSGHQRLPASRFEVETLARMVGGNESTVLTGSDASEQALDQLGKDGLKKFRLLHFATHGDADLLTPHRSRLILAQDKLPSVAEKLDAIREQAKVYTGEVTVQTILQEWYLDADLVVLSACQTALGKPAEGDGHLGFAQAFLQKGARSVVLSRWKVEDTATALLMLRFYENALGKRKDLKAPLGRAAALAEARQWLRNLSRSDAERLAEGLTSGELRGSERPELLPAKTANGPVLPAGDRPFAHPFYWASFILVGDPN